MKYIDSDLDYIFIRVQNKKTKHWDNKSLAEVEDEEFENFMAKRFGKGKKFWQDGEQAGLSWCREDKLGLVNWLQEQAEEQGIGKDGIFVMIARHARNKI